MNERIFLSASVPDPLRNPRFFETTDVIAIRDSVRALATIVLPDKVLVWGGHPAITPMIRVIADSMGVNVQEHVWLYQSEFFRDLAPPDNEAFAHIEWIPRTDDRQSSLEKMRLAMLRSGSFKAGVFIGGMEGVLEEFELFREIHPQAILLPVASTGGAALEIYSENPRSYPSGLLYEYAYASLFRNILTET